MAKARDESLPEPNRADVVHGFVDYGELLVGHVKLRRDRKSASIWVRNGRAR